MNQVSVTDMVGIGELLRQAVFFRAAELDAPGFGLGSHNARERVAIAHGDLGLGICIGIGLGLLQCLGKAAGLGPGCCCARACQCISAKADLLGTQKVEVLGHRFAPV